MGEAPLYLMPKVYVSIDVIKNLAGRGPPVSEVDELGLTLVKSIVGDDLRQKYGWG